MRQCRLLTPLAVVLLLAGSAGAAEWQVPGDFPSIQEAIDSPSVQDGDSILVAAGQHAGATVTKSVAIRALGLAQIVDGPVVSPFGAAGFYFPGDGAGSGASIAGFTFAGIPLPVFSRGADDVTVTRNRMSFFLQGVTSWGYGSWGNRWEITENTMHNPMTSCGGGIGVFIGDFMGGTVLGNLVARNSIRGRLRVPDDECGGYNAPGIALYADFRGGADGAYLTSNLVSKNHVALVSNAKVVGTESWIVTVSGIELTDTRDDPGLPPVVEENVITYNDLRGMKVPFSATPDELLGANTFANNYTAPPSPFPDRSADRSRVSGQRLSSQRRPARPGPLPIR
jgi:hypothetical protein